MGSFRVYVREPAENKRLRRKILDCGWWSVNAAASARKRVENKAAGEISPFFPPGVYGAREPRQGSALRSDERAQTARP